MTSLTYLCQVYNPGIKRWLESLFDEKEKRIFFFELECDPNEFGYLME